MSERHKHRWSYVSSGCIEGTEWCKACGTLRITRYRDNKRWYRRPGRE